MEVDSEIIELENGDFLTHLLLPKITILARKCLAVLLTNKTFEGNFFNSSGDISSKEVVNYSCI